MGWRLLKMPAGGEVEGEGGLAVVQWTIERGIFEAAPESQTPLLSLPGEVVRGFETEAVLGGDVGLDVETVLLAPPVSRDPGRWSQVIGGASKQAFGGSTYRMAQDELLESKAALIDGMCIPDRIVVSGFGKFDP